MNYEETRERVLHFSLIIIIIKNVIKQRIDYRKKLNEEFCFYGNLHLLS